MTRQIISFRAQLILDGKIIGSAAAAYLYHLWPETKQINFHASFVETHMFIKNNTTFNTVDTHFYGDYMHTYTDESQAISMIKHYLKNNIGVQPDINILVDNYMLQNITGSKHVLVTRVHEDQFQIVRVPNEDSYTENKVDYKDSLATIEANYLK